MKITNNIKIICHKCGSDLPVLVPTTHDLEHNLWIFEVLPCQSCLKKEKSDACTPILIPDSGVRNRYSVDNVAMLQYAIKAVNTD